MTIKELCSRIARQEGLKHEASIGDVREIVGIICDELGRLDAPQMYEFVTALLKNGKRRAKRKLKR